MDKELDDILKNLRNCSETPPASLSESVLSSIEIDLSLPEQLLSLQAHEIAPAPQLFENISKTISKQSVRGKLTIQMFVRAAAIFVLLIMATWYALQTASKKGSTTSSSQPMVPQTPVETYKDAGGFSDLVQSSKPNSPRIFLSDSYAFQVKPPGKNEMAMVDNDLLYTLMNCNYFIMRPYQQAKKNQLVINVDQYSSVEVNEKMIRFMNVLYKKNRRQRSTWKARRAKNTLARWKKKDSEYFDASTEHQPMDIINIAEFIQNNR